MTCEDLDVLLHGFLDDELDLARSLEVQKHLDGCPACARRLAAQRSLRAALQDEALYDRAPAGFEDRARAALRAAGAIAGPRAEAARDAWAAPRRRTWAWIPAAAAALLTVAVVGIWRLGPAGPGRSADDLLAQEVIASHVRSLMADHLTDVPSSDQHTVKPWFAGRLDFAPPVKDLTSDGFTLAGGRLDYLAGRPVAALVYDRRRHVINLMLWPAPGEPDRPPIASTLRGYNLLHWTRGGLTYWAISDLNAAELRGFADLIQQ